MSYKWDTHIPDGINERTWRRKQIANYCKLYPQSKPRDIMNWLGEQTPNPWPSCNSNIVSKILRRLKKSKETFGLVISKAVSSTDVPPLTLQWNFRKPLGTDVHKWRRAQIARYIDEYPMNKPRHALKWLRDHPVNP